MQQHGLVKTYHLGYFLATVYKHTVPLSDNPELFNSISIVESEFLMTGFFLVKSIGQIAQFFCLELGE